jgi:hypothetical protein
VEVAMNGLSSTLQAFAEQAFRVGSWRGELPPTTSFSPDGARAMSELVLGHPAVTGDGRPGMQLRLFGPTDEDGLEVLRGHTVAYLVSGAVALGLTGKDFGDDLGAGLIHAAADPDPESLLLRANLLRERLFEPPPPVIPEWLEEIDRFVERECFAGVLKAVLELGRWAGSRSTSYSIGITQVTPSPVCGNSQVTLHGIGLGTTQPAGVVVYVPTLGGGCREAKVESWSDTAVVVRAPADIGTGCAGFVQLGGEFHEPQGVTGELTSCIGPAAEVWTRGFERVGTPIVSCPPCLPGGQNRIYAGGKPVVNRFLFTPDLVEPGGRPTLTWNVSNATDVQITTISGPPLAVPSPAGLVGLLTLAPVVGLAPVTGQYLLTATNPCGTTTAVAEFHMRPTPLLSVTRIEVVQSIQTPTNTVRLVANRRTAVRVFVDSGISDGFDFGTGLGPNRIGDLYATLVAENLDTGAVFDCGLPWAGPHQAGVGLNRDVLTDSINFDVPLAACDGNVEFRATIMQPGPPGSATSAPAMGSVQVSFTTKASQMLLPFLVTDPSSTSPPPTMTDFYTCLSGPAEAHPFTENGFIVNPPLPFTLSGPEKLSSGANWNWLLLRIQTNTFLFASQPVGGVRMAVVPNDSAYPWGGLTLPRTGAGAPTLLIQARYAETCIHEMGHAAGLLHVNCGGPAGPYGGLPFTITDPGLNVTTRTLIPSGSNEEMSYCFPRWPSIPHWEHMFNSVPFA